MSAAVMSLQPHAFTRYEWLPKSTSGTSTKHRALCIACAYPGTSYELHGTVKDQEALKKGLEDNGYSVTFLSDADDEHAAPTKANILKEIANLCDWLNEVRVTRKLRSAKSEHPHIRIANAGIPQPASTTRTLPPRSPGEGANGVDQLCRPRHADQGARLVRSSLVRLGFACLERTLPLAGDGGGRGARWQRRGDGSDGLPDRRLAH